MSFFTVLLEFKGGKDHWLAEISKNLISQILDYAFRKSRIWIEKGRITERGVILWTKM